MVLRNSALLLAGIASALPALAQLSLPPPLPPAVPPPPIPAPGRALPTSVDKPKLRSPFKKPTAAKPRMQESVLLTPPAPAPETSESKDTATTDSPEKGGRPAKAAESVRDSSFETKPGVPVSQDGKSQPKEESKEERAPLFASPQELQEQRKACTDFRISSSQVSLGYTQSTTLLKGTTKAKANCILASQPSADWVVVTISGGNSLEVRAAQNNTAEPRAATVRIATPQTSLLVEVKQAGNPSEFLPL